MVKESGDDGLGAVARSGLAAVVDGEPDQGQLEGMDYTHFKFSGVTYQTLEKSAKIGDTYQFAIRVRVIGIGDEEMSDGHVRHLVKVKGESMVPMDDKA